MARLALPAQPSLLGLGPNLAFSSLLGAPAGVLSEPSHDCHALLSRSLSGGELPLDNLNEPSAAAAAAAAPCAAARVSRAVCVKYASGPGRLDGGARASIAAGRAAAAALARPGAAGAWQTVAWVPAVGDSESLGASAADFCVSHVRNDGESVPCNVGSKTSNSLGAEPSARPRGKPMHCMCQANLWFWKIQSGVAQTMKRSRSQAPGRTTRPQHEIVRTSPALPPRWQHPHESPIPACSSAASRGLSHGSCPEPPGIARGAV